MMKIAREVFYHDLCLQWLGVAVVLVYFLSAFRGALEAGRSRRSRERAHTHALAAGE